MPLSMGDWDRAGHLNPVKPITFELLGFGIQTMTFHMRLGWPLEGEGFAAV